jgi:hypothetical protein
MTVQLRQLWEFCLQVLAGGIVFGLIAGLGVGIFLLNGWMQKIGMPEIVTRGFTAVQFLLRSSILSPMYGSSC